MTDFVLHESFGVENEIIDKNEFYAKVSKYADFLKQPLTHSMFIICDDTGTVLLKPKVSPNLKRQYNEAKGKVLFEGFELQDSGWYENKDEIKNTTVGIDINLKSGSISVFQPNGIGYGVVKTIEDLTEYGLELTETSINQIEINN